VPIGSDELRLKHQVEYRRDTARDVSIGSFSDGDVRNLEQDFPPIEFDTAVFLELRGVEGLSWSTTVTADRSWELTAQIRQERAHYTLRYAVSLGVNDGNVLEPADCEDGACKVEPVQCNVSDPVQPCPLANLVVEVKSRTGTPIEAARVTVSSKSGGVVATAVTDAYGMAKFGTINSGAYSASATKPRHVAEQRSVSFVVGVAETRIVRLTLDPPFVYFALYYTKPKDKAFQRAAETWKRSVQARPTYHATADDIQLIGFLNENDFTNAWQAVQRQAVGFNRTIIEGHVFSHGTPDGIEFPDGTLTKSEIRSMSVLNWERPGSEFALHGCRAAVGGSNSPAAAFAERQRVKTTAFTGYGSFSEKEDTYVETDPNSKDMYLRDYEHKRGRDCVVSCSGDPSNPVVFDPPVGGP
jgi:hypothetical protein